MAIGPADPAWALRVSVTSIRRIERTVETEGHAGISQPGRATANSRRGKITSCLRDLRPETPGCSQITLRSTWRRHKYSIKESIEDGTTLLLYYNLAPNEMLASPDLMEKEFWSVAETEGITDIEELNKILDRAVNLKNFLKGDERVDKIARYVAEHYVTNVEPLGYKAFLVGVDRPACAKY